MRILNAHINTAHHGAIQVAPSPPGRDEELWTVPGGRLRDASCFTSDVLGSDPLVLTIQLAANPSPSTRITIEGRTRHGSSGFAEDVRGFVEPADWQDGTAECHIQLASSDLQTRGVTSAGALWDWQWKDDQPRGPLGPSEHLIFVIAGAPAFPWTAAVNPGPNETRPWPGALALACEWARGESTTAAIPDRILAGIVSLGGGPGDPWKYDSAARSYLNPAFGPPVFYCELFLAAVRDLDQRLPHRLSCYEGAAVMTTFSNLLGSEVQPVLVRHGECDDFRLNMSWPLGRAPQSGGCFHVHVVACTPSRESRSEFRAYDPLIRLDTDRRPADEPNQFEFLSGVRLGALKDPAGSDVYLPQLIHQADIGSCRVHDLPVAQIELPDQFVFNPCDLERYQRYIDLLQARISGRRPGAPTTFRITGFRRFPGTDFPAPPPRPDKLPAVPPRTRTVYEPEDPGAPDSIGVRLMADFWTAPTDRSLRFMAELMALADRPPVRVGGPDIAYISPDGETLWVLLDGATARLTSVGRTPKNLEDVLNVSTPE